MTADARTHWRNHGTRLLKAGLWATSAALLGWFLGLQPTWQLLVLALACLVFDFVDAKSADWKARWVEQLIRFLLWALVFAALCWLLGLQPTWQLLLFAVACAFIDAVLDRLLPTPPILSVRSP